MLFLTIAKSLKPYKNNGSGNFFLVFLIKTNEIISFPKEKQAFAHEKNLKPYKYNGFGIKKTKKKLPETLFL